MDVVALGAMSQPSLISAAGKAQWPREGRELRPAAGITPATKRPRRDVLLHYFCSQELSDKERKVPEQRLKNDLHARLDKLDLTFADIPRLCPPGMAVSLKTVQDLAAGRRYGDRRSWERICAALNAYLKSNAYDVEDLIGETYSQYLRHWYGAGAGKEPAQAATS